MNPGDPNLRNLELAADRMGTELREQLVFVGGAVVGLLVTDPAAAGVRPTDDVDTIVSVVSQIAYSRIERALRELGFAQDPAASAPICRWQHGSEVDRILLYVMPTQEEILGFSNRWYPLAIATAKSVCLPSGLEIRVITAPAFQATKLVAFDQRGHGDFRASHDLEDVVAVVDGRSSLPDECNASSPELREWLAHRMSELLQTSSFLEALPGHLPPEETSQARRQDVIDALRRIARARADCDLSEMLPPGALAFSGRAPPGEPRVRLLGCRGTVPRSPRTGSSKSRVDRPEPPPAR